MTNHIALRSYASRMKGTSKNLLRAQIAALVGARNPHVLRVHSGFSAPPALHFARS